MIRSPAMVFVMVALLAVASNIRGQGATKPRPADPTSPASEAPQVAPPLASDGFTAEAAAPAQQVAEETMQGGGAPGMGTGGYSAAGFARPPELVIRVINADGTPAVGARVLESEPGMRRVIFNGRQLEPLYYGPMAGSSTDLGFAQTDDQGRYSRVGFSSSSAGGGFGMGVGFGMGGGLGMGGGPSVLWAPALLVLGKDDQYGFLPAEKDLRTLQLRKGTKLRVKLAHPANSTTSYTLLAWWNNGFALPNAAKDLGFKQPDIHAVGWKFRPSFAVFQTAPFSAGDDRHATLTVPPGEVRLTVVPTEMLPTAEFATPQQSSEEMLEDATADPVQYAELARLALYGGPSQIIAATAGTLQGFTFDECDHTLNVQRVELPQSLPEWDGPTAEDATVFLIRQTQLPGHTGVEVTPGSPAHESLLLSHRPVRSQLPAVRVGMRTEDGNYRFDLLCPGIYQVRLGTWAQLSVTAAVDHRELGQLMHVRPVAAASVDDATPPGRGQEVMTYEIDFQPSGKNWKAGLLIGRPQAADSDPFRGMPGGTADPFGSPIDDPFRVIPGGDDPFASPPDASDPFDAAPAGGDIFGATPSGGDPFDGAMPGMSPRPIESKQTARSSAPAPAGKPAVQQARLRELRARIQSLQQQLDAAAALVDQLQSAGNL